MDTTGEPMDWRVDTPPIVIHKRPRDETEDDETRIRLERDTPIRSIPGAFEPAPERPIIKHDNLNRFATVGVESAPAQATPQLGLSSQKGSFWQYVNGTITLITYVSKCVVKSIGARTFRAGRFIYENRYVAAVNATETVTASQVGATGPKRRKVQYNPDAFTRNPQPPPRRPPPRLQPHPYHTNPRIRRRNEERARKEEWEAASREMAEAGRRPEPTMSGALPIPNNFEPTIAPTLQVAFGSQTHVSHTPQLATNPKVSTGAMSDDAQPLLGDKQFVTEDNSDSDEVDEDMGSDRENFADTLPEPWPPAVIDHIDSFGSDIQDSDSDKDELMSEENLSEGSDIDELMSGDDDNESPTTDNTNPRVGLWEAADRLQCVQDVNESSGLDWTSPLDLFSKPEAPKNPQSATGGLSASIMFSPTMTMQKSYKIFREPQSSPLSDVPSDFDSLSPAMTPVRRSPQKSVAFFASPKTGKPVDSVRKYYVNEPMFEIVSSSPQENSESDSISGFVDSDDSIYDDPTRIAAAAASGVESQQQLASASKATRSNLPLMTTSYTPPGSPDPASFFHPRNFLPITGDGNEDEIAGCADSVSADASFISDGSLRLESKDRGIAGCNGDMPVDASLISNGSIDSENSEVDGAVGYMPASASLPIHGPILAPIQNNQYVGRQTLRRTNPSYMITATELGSPIKKRRSPPASARSLSRISMDSMIMQENIEHAPALVNIPVMAPVVHKHAANQGENTSPAERTQAPSKGDSPARQRRDSPMQVMASEIAATPGPQATGSDQSTPSSDLVAQLGSLKMSDRRHSVRRIQHEREERKLREKEEKRVAEEKARKEREQAEAIAEKARLEAAKVEEAVRLEKEAEEERKSRSVREIPVEEVIQPLSGEWEAKVDVAMAQGRNDVLASTSTGTTLTRKDLGTLFPQAGRDPASGWLNDEVIMAYLQAVVDHGREISGYKDGDVPKYHAFNTFFFKNIRDKGVQSVKRWATKAKIGGKSLDSVERVFIPVHSGAHWTLLVVSPMAKTIEYFDSMGGRTAPFVKAAQEWLKQEMGKSYHDEEWMVLLPEGGGPQQDNGSDCGVFTVTTAKMILLGIDPMAYSSLDIPLQRKRMVAELMNGGFTADFAPSFTFESEDDGDEVEDEVEYEEDGSDEVEDEVDYEDEDEEEL